MKKGFILLGIVITLMSISCESSMNKQRYKDAIQNENLGLCPYCHATNDISSMLDFEDRISCHRCLKKSKMGVMRNYYMDYMTDQYISKSQK